MSITKKQRELDVIKWEKSVNEGKDACGSFDYCEKCDKTLENPCDKAFKSFNKPAKAVKALKATTKTTKKAAK